MDISTQQKEAVKPQPKTAFIIGMRDAYFNALYQIFLKDKKTMFISADNGAPTMDQISVLPNQFQNVGIAEQQMIGMACGLALEGRQVWVYCINPFISFRSLEFVKLDMCAMNLPIIALGVGAGFAYDIMGPTHHSVGSIAVTRPWPNLKIYDVADDTTAAALAEINYEDKGPQYVQLDRAGIPNLYAGKNINFRDGIIQVKEGKDAYIVAHGIMVHQALKVSALLEAKGMKIGVIDLFRMKPVNHELLFQYISGVPKVISLEEDYLAGGMGSIIAELFVDNGITKPLLRIGQPDNFVFDLGGREVIWERNGLDEESLVKKISEWL
jgi:transketolase